ncbi:putative retrotransposon ty1-copia subclass protein [Tanacetum coccineum]|uniref:Retrotransposon ty1-copia subclass protein n=1 Tax=Tanacetum coccineum TaxID=301880 RepID=A0ABQ5EK76_9ASTR
MAILPIQLEQITALCFPECFQRAPECNVLVVPKAKDSLPFFDTLKNITKENKDEYKWTEEAERAFQEMKKLIMDLPSLTTPTTEETLYVYLALATEAVTAVLLTKRKGKLRREAITEVILYSASPPSPPYYSSITIEACFLSNVSTFLAALQPLQQPATYVVAFTDIDGKVHIFKARLVEKGYTKTYGVDYRETFSPVANIRAIRILLAIVAFYDYEIWQMDVKTAFLNGHLSEDVYMVQPKGFVDPKRPNRVCKLQRSIYGLKQASRSWNKRAVDWKSAKQSTTAMSSTKAKYIAAAEASIEAIWMRKFIDGLGNFMPLNKRPIDMPCDNDLVIIVLKKVHTDDNVADPLTKPMLFNKHFKHAMAIGIVPASGLMSIFLDVITTLSLEYEHVAMNLTLLERGRFIIRTSLTGFPAQSVRSSNADALDSLYLLVSLYRTPQSRLPH